MLTHAGSRQTCWLGIESQAVGIIGREKGINIFTTADDKAFSIEDGDTTVMKLATCGK